MKTKVLLAAACIGLFLFFTSFRQVRSDHGLPPITHTGENVMACRVNGQVIIAAENPNDPSNPAAVKFSEAPDNDLLYIGGIFVSPRYDIEISFRYGDSLGTYPILYKYPYFGYFWDYTKSMSVNDSNQFQPDRTHGGNVTVTYLDANIIAGTFSFEAINRKGKVVHVTEGRFDIARH